ncbi:glycosyltransferase family 2 protein [Mumia flava]|uniref:glycosyltransferase family 2 protein n=1 Tax=Mumia flava TaxID=1348852 RepID=UPI0012FDD40E|nr:glycosyltransferase family 2 protein [Mumia flava]
MTFPRFPRRRRTGPEEDAPPPVLGVVVPVYNVEDYLAECLESVLGQSYRHLDVVVVDDGSPDGSVAIAERFAAEDARVRIVRRDNGGLGAARNTGAHEARGHYLTFVDSDDVVPEGAFEAMVGTLEQSGSDFCVGRTERLVDGEVVHLPWAETLHAVDRIGVPVTDVPRVVRDFYTWNKIFRTSFWRGQGFAFREGVLFEDQPLITDAYCRAGAIDIVSDAAYRWRRRTDGSSLTQGMFAPDKIAERQEAITLTRPVVDACGDEGVRDAWLWTLMDSHLPLYLATTARLEQDEPLRAAVRMVRSAITADDVGRIPGVSALHKVMLHLALGPDPEALRRFVAAGGRARNRWPVRVRDGRVVAELPVDDRHSIPPSAFELDPEEIVGVARALAVGWSEDGAVRVHGCAYLDPIEIGAGREIAVAALDRTTGRRVELCVRARREGWPGPASPRPWIDVVDGTFEAVLDPGDLPADAGAARWELVATLGYGPHVREVPLVAEFPGWVVGGPATRWIAPDVTGTLGVHDDGVLSLDVQRCPVRARLLEETEEGLAVELESVADVALTEVHLARAGAHDVVPAELRALQERRWRAVWAAPQDLDPEARWRLETVVDGDRVGLRAPAEVLDRAAVTSVRPYLTHASRVRLAPTSRASVTVTAIGLAAGTLRIRGEAHGTVGQVGARVSRHDRTAAGGTEAGEDGTFTLDLPLESEDGRPLPDGRYVLRFVGRLANDPEQPERPLRWRAALAVAVPYDLADDTLEVRLLPGADRRFGLRLSGRPEAADDHDDQEGA